jgi:hypothetical protein
VSTPDSMPDPKDFADEWVRAWNGHDVKPALRDYWVTALGMLPEPHFDVIGVYRVESLLVIDYRNERGGLVNEVLIFDEGGLVREGHGTYRV